MQSLGYLLPNPDPSFDCTLKKAQDSTGVCTAAFSAAPTGMTPPRGPPSSSCSSLPGYRPRLAASSALSDADRSSARRQASRCQFALCGRGDRYLTGVRHMPILGPAVSRRYSASSCDDLVILVHKTR